MSKEIIQFLRKRDYKWVKELGKGACGLTVLLLDDYINEKFVCKKYVPYEETQRKELFANFVRETKLLHQVYHQNVVRVFNYYLYPEEYSGYILMEYVEGMHVEKYLQNAPEKINEIFIQAIHGFGYLERHKILHRDIRPANILVRNDGVLKIIDLGFGKQISDSKDFDKSVSLNLWCEPPNEFVDAIYDYSTEVYFVGKLFSQIIHEEEITHFEYASTLKQMCNRDPFFRISSFIEIEQILQSNKFYEIEFSEHELTAYREFSDALNKYISKIQHGATYKDDASKIQRELEGVYRNTMLETLVPEPNEVVICFLNGSYYFRNRANFPVSALRAFLHLLKSSSIEKKRIILANLNTKMNAITRYKEPDLEPDEEDDIPF